MLRPEMAEERAALVKAKHLFDNDKFAIDYEKIAEISPCSIQGLCPRC
jgi:hypothetical protein